MFVSITFSYSTARTHIVIKLPESPRWLVKHGHDAEAIAVIAALDDKPFTNHEVQLLYHGIRDALLIEGQSDVDGEANLSELFTGGLSQNFRRASLGVIVQCFQQITGINLITYYAVSIYSCLSSAGIPIDCSLPSRHCCLNAWVSTTSNRASLQPVMEQNISLPVSSPSG